MDYKGTKQFKVEHDDCDEIYSIIQIDFDHKNIWLIMFESVAFYHSISKDEEQEEILDQFLKHIATTAFFHGANGSLNTRGVLHAVQEDEGYPMMDGTNGIHILEFGTISAREDYCYTVEETEGHKPFEPDW